MDLHKMHVASAVQMNGGKSNINLSRKALVTAKIGQIIPIFHQECVPGDKFRVNVNMFSRFAPLAVPSFVDLTYRTMSVFVPYHQVADGIESYISNQARFKGVLSGIPQFSLQELGVCFTSSGMSSYGTASSYDFYFQPATGTNYYYTFSAKGRYCMKVLHCLGYRFPKSWSGGSATGLRFNALPLLAFAHAYNSYLSYSANYNTSQLSADLENVKRSPNSALPTGCLYHILSSILLTYEESFLSTAWASPFYSLQRGASSTVSSNFRITDVSDVESLNLSYGTDSPNYGSGLGIAAPISEGDNLTASQVRLMLKWDDYFRRNNYGGSKDIEQIYSRFGVKIDDYKTRYPYFLGETAQKVQIGDVTSTSDTASSSTGAVLGSYAGKAIGDGDAHFNFEASDFGMLFVFAWFAPRPLYYLGCDKETLRLNPFDYYTPELDQGFPSALSMLQVDATKVGVYNFGGYVPLFSEYLYANDIVAGDYEDFTGFNAWHFGREDFTSSVTAQSDSLIYLPQSGSQYERIFNIADTTLVDADTIYMTCNCECSAVRPMKDYVGKSGLGDGSVDLPALGSQMN